MRRVVLVVLMMCAAAVVRAVDPGEAAPAWTATDFAGNEVAFPAVVDGKPSVVIFWATWCPYCKAFMPYLGRIQEDYGSGRINVIAINAKERGEGDPAAYVESLGYPVIGVADGDAIAERYGVRFIPGLMIVDGDGTLAWQRASTDLPPGQTVAEFWDGQVREQLDRLLAADPAR